MPSTTLTMPVVGNLGNIEGPASDGVLVGQLTATDPTKVLLKEQVSSGMCCTDDGGTYVDDSADWADAGADDVEALPATPAAEDALYIGHSTGTFAKITTVIGTAGAGTWTIVWEYWNGTSYAALAGVTDGTTGFTAAPGSVDVTFTLPVDWAMNTVDGINGYWVRARVSAYTSVTTQPLLTSGFVTLTTAAYIDDTTDFTDAGTDDCPLLGSLSAVVGDGVYIGYTEAFCKLKVTTGIARTGTATLVLKYWDGSAWTAIPTIDDDSVGWSATAGTHIIHFVPPADWVANTAANGPGGNAGWFVAMEITAVTSITALPVATQGWVYPMKTGASGVDAPQAAQHLKLTFTAGTASATNADSEFAVVNTTKGTAVGYTWTKADVLVEESNPFVITKGDGIALVQVTEDGTTEFADASINLEFT